MRFVLFAVVFFAAGFAAGLYSLPVIQAARMESPVVAGFTGEEAGRIGSFRDDLPGNDFLHWGRGEVLVTDSVVAFTDVELAPGPDYRLYLVPQVVQDEEEFLAVKGRSAEIAPVKTFSGSAQYAIPAGINPDEFQAVLIWCEAFGEFITLAELGAAVPDRS